MLSNKVLEKVVCILLIWNIALTYIVLKNDSKEVKFRRGVVAWVNEVVKNLETNETFTKGVKEVLEDHENRIENVEKAVK